MKERPINLRPHEVRGIIDGRQTQIRRAMKPQPVTGFLARGVYAVVPQWPHQDGVRWFMNDGLSELVKSPFGAPGDRLWGRESFIHEPADYCWEASVSIPCRPACTIYRADAEDPRGGAWKPSTQMPRELSRITLDLISVRVERLQDISEADALAEGIEYLPRMQGYGLPDGSHYHGTDPRISYWSLLEEINGRESVEANPWMWVISFRRLEQEAP